MINAEQLFRTDIVTSGMIVVGVTAAVIAMFGRWLEAYATRWRSA
jgi:sulfonate transport system permease protein